MIVILLRLEVLQVKVSVKEILQDSIKNYFGNRLQTSCFLRESEHVSINSGLCRRKINVEKIMIDYKC